MANVTITFHKTSCVAGLRMAKYRVSVDIGGTFTDLVALNEESGELLNIKVPSTPKEPANAVIEAFQEFLKKNSGADVSAVVHATTIAANALLGQLNLELPKTALITTKGFRDIVEIGRQRRHELYNLFVQKPRTLVPRRLRFEIEERTEPKGEILTPLNKEEVKGLSQRIKRENVKAIAVALLFSYTNQKHEQEIGKILRQLQPATYVSLSSEITPEYREYERTSTTVVNAVLMPTVSSYLNTLQHEIEKLGVKAPLCVMQSDGGTARKEIVSKKPVSMVESGPAAGVTASAFYGNLLGIDDILSFDMGGTTAKAGAVKAATPEVVNEYEVAGKVHSGRIVKGSGYPVRQPFIDLAECSAGGGTIAWVDEGDALQVGPVSAGAEPGPACYGKGGRQPTVTDANVALGRLNPRFILGGELPIYSKLSEKAISKEVCGKTQLKLTEAAAGIVRIVNSAMAKVLRIVTVERGYDPRDFTLMCFGGAGPMHACALAQELNIPKIVVPPNPGMFSAYGLLTADFKSSYVNAVMKLTTDVDPKKVENVFQKLEPKGTRILRKQRISKANTQFVRQLDLRYFGQSYELTIPANTPFTDTALQHAIENFHKKHKAVCGYAVRKEPVELVNLRLIAVGLVEKPRLKEQLSHGEKSWKEAVITKRKVFFEHYDDYVKTSIYRREKLNSGNVVEGPAVIEQYDATTVVYPRWKASVDKLGNLVLSTQNGGTENGG
jgi:N-methylhydantoinase A